MQSDKNCDTMVLGDLERGEDSVREEKKNDVRNSVVRLMISILGFMVQTLWFVMLIYNVNEYSEQIELFTKLVTVVLVMMLYVNDDLNTNMKMLWIMAILALPVMGLTLYLMYGRRGSLGTARSRHRSIQEKVRLCCNLKDDAEIAQLEKENLGVANQFRYISTSSRFPVRAVEHMEYFSNPAEGLQRHIEEIDKAQHFVFMEYHAIEDSEAFWGILEALERAVARGVEVRIIYDDVGSIGFLTTSFIRKMKKYGIECRVFNRVLPVLNIFMQNRDHRKITVVDGRIAFTGGYNMADEYFGLTHPYGEWKDTGICFDGDAVATMTAMFLYMWNLIKRTDEDMEKYFPPVDKISIKTDAPYGYIQPYGGNPLSREHLPENVYLNMIQSAKRYVYISTPYLIVSSEMQRELTLAAKRGVDVRLVTPGIPDKKMIYLATRSYYPSLVKGGVKIYEYTPGFCHAKQFLCDDEIAVLGTINLDFRSLYHHFENAVLMYRVPILQEMKKDFEHMFLVSEHVSEKYGANRTLHIRIWQAILRLFSPLL